MKKLFLSVLLIASAITYTSAQQATVDASKWSVAVKGGLAYYRVVPIYDHSNWGAGLVLERTVNPLFGWGLDVSYLNYLLNDNDAKGATIDPTLFTSFNFTNFLLPHRQSSAFNLYGKVGAGVGIWSNDAVNGDNLTSGVQPVLTAALHPEIALGKSAALGAEIGYRYYPAQIYGGAFTKDRFEDALTAMLTLRFNLGADHIRNMTLDQYYPAPAPIIQAVENDYDDSNILNRLNNLEKQDQDINNRLDKLEQDIKDLKEKAKGTSITASFQNIEFEFDSAKITEASYPILNQVASILKDNATWSTLKVKGHTDSTGPDSYNLKLSERRAQAVKDYLASQGVSSSAISAVGFGEGQPIATNDTAEGRKANRRVEFEVIK